MKPLGNNQGHASAPDPMIMSQDQASPGRRRDAPEPSLSETDLQLIDLLREDARRSISTLAALIGTSRPAIRRRIDRLQAQGVIRRFTVETALPAATTADRGIDALFSIVARTGSHRGLLATIRQRPECRAAWAVTGTPDLIIIVHCLSVAALDGLRDHLARHTAVKSVSTAVILDGWQRDG
ncbi:MAG: hypothetical protein CMO30_28480 [Tistrella sp.]|uniref:HTH asnC-type domain-containing protein n=3 Tax=Geminicoccaceae TaxID=2066434 RepID=A0A3B9IHR4_9PROT|nr:hypothetical protein [Tistrella sp.]MBA79212.1 hypothetical protein [Tistrella sp.]HAE46837.1 hypothetical protein [Tistrella mobilis]|tara:strand:- start:279 stop:824 length:546 start_codon:yes stop_codon:yes gene_type:complete